MLIEMDLRNHVQQVGWSDLRIVPTGGTYKIRCAYVPIRCGEETVTATASMRFSYTEPHKAGSMEVFATAVPGTLRAMLSDERAWVDGAFTLRGPVDIAGLALPAGTLVLSADTRDGPVTFRVAPVKKADFAALIERQIAEREASREAIRAVNAWEASG